MSTQLIGVIPVLPSAAIARDIAWYKERTGFEVHYSDAMYAVLYRDSICLHLQWHADTESDPLLGGSVIRLQVANLTPLFQEFVQRGTVKETALRLDTPWGTDEFGFFDLNQNAIFIVAERP